MHPSRISADGIKLIKAFEGLDKKMDDGLIRSYRCIAGRWTIGWGHTKGVRSGQKLTVLECEQFLLDDLRQSEADVKRLVKVPLSQNQFDALVSFVFNLGAGNFSKSTALKKINSSDFDDVPEQLLRWNKARVDNVLTTLAGLTRRRTAEAALFSMDAVLAEDGGELMPQKPEPTAKKPLKKSKTIAGAATAGAGTLGTVVTEAAGNLQSLTAYSDMLKIAFVVLSVLGIGLVTYARVNSHNTGES